jgi:hypothetical protein
VANPVGFLPNEVTEAVLGLWLVVLGVLILLSVGSLFVRYRRAGAVVRTQMRWLLYACGLFALVYVPGIFLPVGGDEGAGTLLGELWNLAFMLTLLAIPASIAIGGLTFSEAVPSRAARP